MTELGLVSYLTDIEQLNVTAKHIGNYLEKNPALYKAVVVINHLFRAMLMAVFMVALPYGLAMSCAVSLGASLFYRLTIERNCAFKFALPSCLGGISYHLSRYGVHSMVAGIMLRSVDLLNAGFIGSLPLTLWTFAIISITDDDVEKRYLKPR